MKDGRVAVIILDWVCIACIIYTLVWGIHNQITIGSPFGDDAVIQWACWAAWALWCGSNPVKRIFGGHKVNG